LTTYNNDVYTYNMELRTYSTNLPELPCACAALRRASRAVTQAYGRVMRESGMEVTQFTLLQVLRQAGPMTQGRLGEFLAMDSTTLSRSLRPLEASSWIQSGQGSDRRQRCWKITAAGNKELKRVEPLWLMAQARMQKSIGEHDWKLLMRSADRASEAALSM